MCKFDLAKKVKTEHGKYHDPDGKINLPAHKSNVVSLVNGTEELHSEGKDNEAEAMKRPGAITMEQGGRKMTGLIFVFEEDCDAENLRDWIGHHRRILFKKFVSSIATIPISKHSPALRSYGNLQQPSEGAFR